MLCVCVCVRERERDRERQRETETETERETERQRERETERMNYNEYPAAPSKLCVLFRIVKTHRQSLQNWKVKVSLTASITHSLNSKTAG